MPQLTVTIYTLADPLTNEVRYVGKTVNALKLRLSQHLNNKNGCHRVNWIKSLKNRGLLPVIEELEIVSKDEWSEAEKFYIEYFRFLGFRLTNMTSGGDGAELSQETKNKISAILKGKPKSAEHRKKISKLNEIGAVGMRGQKHKEESKAKISAWLKGKPRSESCKEKIRIANAPKKIPIIQLSKDGEFIKEWPSIVEAATTLGFCKGHIIKVCKGSIDSDGYTVKTSYGFKWKYKYN